MQFWKKKIICHGKLIYFLLSPSFSFQTGKWKEKTLKNPFSYRNIIFYIKMACITFYVTWKRDFPQNVVKTNKKV